MPKRRKKKKKMPRTSKVRGQQKPQQTLISRIMTWSGWLASLGVLALTGAFINDFVRGDIDVEFVKEVSRGYELKLVNKRPTTQQIEYFRVTPDLEQAPIFTVSQQVYGTMNEDGMTMPGGNESYVPAFEFEEMNGYTISARSDVKFKIPPLVSKEYLRPQSVVVYAEYKTTSKNAFLRRIEEILHLTNKDIRKKFLVSDNYWTPIANATSVNALEVACRDTEWFSKTSECEQIATP